MTKPRCERIFDVVLERLREINVSNGYSFTVREVVGNERDTNSWVPGVRKIRVEQGEITENEGDTYPGNPPRIAFDSEIVITGYAKQIDRDASEVGMADSSVSEWEMIAAIKNALVAGDSLEWFQFDGNAHFAEITGSSVVESPGLMCGQVTLMVRYRHAETDAYT